MRLKDDEILMGFDGSTPIYVHSEVLAFARGANHFGIIEESIPPFDDVKYLFLIERLVINHFCLRNR